MTGSNRESVMDMPLLLGGLPMNELTAALRRCSSSISLFFLRRRLKKRKAPRDDSTITPTTTPAAIPAVLGPLESSSAAGLLVATGSLGVFGSTGGCVGLAVGVSEALAFGSLLTAN